MKYKYEKNVNFCIIFTQVIMNLLVKRIIYNISAAAKQYQIVKNKYLVPVKPSRPLSAFILFCNEQRSKITGNMVEVSKALGEQWAKLDAEKKKHYEELSKQQKQKQAVLMEQYNQLYVLPFKRTANVSNLVMKQIYKDNKVNFGEGGKLLKEKMEKISEQERKDLEAKIQEAKLQNHKNQQKYLIPELQFKTERAFIMRQAGDKRLSELTEHQRIAYANKYQKYLENHQRNLTKFASNFNLTLHDLIEIIKLHEKRQKRETKDLMKDIGIQETPRLRAPRTVARKATTTRATASTKAPKATTGASRVKKTAPKKTTKAKAAVHAPVAPTIPTPAATTTTPLPTA